MLKSDNLVNHRGQARDGRQNRLIKLKQADHHHQPTITDHEGSEPQSNIGQYWLVGFAEKSFGDLSGVMETLLSQILGFNYPGLQ